MRSFSTPNTSRPLAFIRIVLCALVLSCSGKVSPAGVFPAAGGGTAPPGVAQKSTETGPRRLTRRELLRSINRLTSVDVVTELPAFDVNTLLEGAPKPFFYDAFYRRQQTPTDFLLAVDELARLVSEAVVKDASRMTTVAGCDGAGTTQAKCLEQFVTRFGRRALRRALEPDEVKAIAAEATKWIAPTDAPKGAPVGFGNAVAFVIRAMLVHPEFLFLVEGASLNANGEAVLSDFEMASRLSFTLWGEGPDDVLLDAAQNGAMHTDEQIRAAASRMLDDDKAKTQLEDFHAGWLNFGRLGGVVSPKLAQSMRQETRALLNRVIFEKNAPYPEVFTAPDSFIDADLASVYQMRAPSNGLREWVTYPDDGKRGGILSHGSVLATSGPGSVTLRGLFIREHLLCTPLKTPKELMVDFDAINNPNLGRCKSERLKAHAQGVCASCHAQIDPLGFGLIRFNGQGAYQTTEPDKDDCVYAEEGALQLGSKSNAFKGPKALGALLAARPELMDCLSHQYFRFVTGRFNESEDEARIAALNLALSKNENRLKPALLDWVSDPLFRQRRVDAVDDDKPDEE